MFPGDERFAFICDGEIKESEGGSRRKRETGKRDQQQRRGEGVRGMQTHREQAYRIIHMQILIYPQEGVRPEKTLITD